MIIISGYDPAHAGAITDIERMSFSDPWGAESLLRTIGGGNTLTLVALEDKAGREKTPVGYVCALLAGAEAEILKLAVLPTARERGTGQMLVNSLIAGASQKGAVKIFIEVRESNRAARILYEKCRFRYMGRRSNYYDNPREDAVLMGLEMKK